MNPASTSDHTSASTRLSRTADPHALDILLTQISLATHRGWL
jgi:hypothetical protein